MSRFVDQAALLVTEIGDPAFSQKYAETCRDIFDNDQCTVFCFSEGEAPSCLIADAMVEETKQITRTLADEYIETAHLRDPTMREIKRAAGSSREPMIKKVSATEIRDNVYRARFYEEALVRQKIAIVSFVGRRILYSNFYRNPEQRDFDQSDIDALVEIGPLLCRILAKHFDLTADAQPASVHPQELTKAFRDKLQEKVRVALLQEDCSLTPREAEVCAAIAIGYTTEAVGLNFGISMNTVATHRKRAYSKLQISSQNELFARYIQHSALAR